ncbi:MAG: GNAT family N-acetyltransferase [Alphaproteobacteria bacterium]|nr:GNAT family N-acetyltransferase [Alphaproteobacteria bacterium]
MVEIAKFEPKDQPSAAAMVVEIQNKEFGVAITYEQQQDLIDPAAFFRKGAGEFWVARTPDGDVVGTIGLVEFAPGEGALRKMFVRADHRGSTHGIAQRLLDALLAHARSKRLQMVWLGTTALFKAAHRFYEKNGFSLVDEAELPPAFPRMKPDTRFYRIAL